ncbi:hypothetical protein J1N35_039108 [Gossypium stocksii]|uniref:Bromodomain associated domain-containing protein n=1 Tax=Gossypium stocksii TaxID=47602 RepID=A0A9D3UP27_9ROSI|nr:hypothetical protein J1N35_039108 [Gossypium stocksii]
MRKSRPKRKSNIHLQQPTTNPRDFQFMITKVAVSQICKSVGFRRSRVSALETLTLVATKYLETLVKSAASFSNAASRTQSNILDLTNALHDMSLQVGFMGASTLYDHNNNCLLKSSVLESLSDFVSSTNEIPFAKPIERAKERGSEEVNAVPESLQERGGHIPEWLPRFPDVGGTNENCDKRVNGEQSLWENSSSVLRCQIDDFEEKRCGSNNVGKLPKGRSRIKFRVNNGGGTRVGLNGISCNNVFGQSKDEEEAEPVAVCEKSVKSEEKQIIVYKRRKKRC